MIPCDAARGQLHDRLDGELPAEHAGPLDQHLAGCTSCREVAEGLARVQQALRALPEVALPDASLDTVWERTIGVGPAAVPPGPRPVSYEAEPIPFPSRQAVPQPRRSSVPKPVWWMAAAAAVVLVAVLAWRSAEQAASVARMEKAEADARLALGLAAQALRTTERAAVQRVLKHEVSPAIRHIPIHWSRPADPETGRSRT